ncbi:MAG: hypothetical protein IJZ74_09340 [Clostridia bacterium]|nr:hypothetical protein [Clostridia bacterium]
MSELDFIMHRFAASGWALIALPAAQYLSGAYDRSHLISALMQADMECGSCGCDLDPLYKRALFLLQEGCA